MDARRLAPAAGLLLFLSSFASASPGFGGGPSAGDGGDTGYDADGFSTIGNEGPNDTYGGGDPKRCRPPGVMPTRKPPWPSCDPILHDAIVAKRDYDQSEDAYTETKNKVERAEDWLEQVNADKTASRQTRERAREALLRARQEHEDARIIGEDNAMLYKKAEEALRQDRGQYLDKNSYDKAKNALEFVDIENTYNRKEQLAAARSRSYAKKGQAFDPTKVPEIGAGGFVGGGNTNASRKNRSGNRYDRSKLRGQDFHSGGEYKTGNEAGWEDGGNGGELGDGGDKRPRLLASASGGSGRPGGPGFSPSYSSAFGGVPMSKPGQGSLGFVKNSDGVQSLQSPEQASRSIGGPGLSYLREAEAKLTQQDYAGAAKSAAYATRLDPSNVEAHVLSAKAYNRLGDYEKAERAARDALKLNPNDANAYQELAWSLLHQGDYEKAVKMASYAVQLNPKSAEALMIRAFAYEMLGKRDLMLADIEAAAKLDSKFEPHLQQAKSGGKLFDPTRKDTLTLLTGVPAFPMMEGQDPMKLGLFFFSALALGLFAIWQLKKRKAAV